MQLTFDPLPLWYLRGIHVAHECPKNLVDFGWTRPNFTTTKQIGLRMESILTALSNNINITITNRTPVRLATERFQGIFPDPVQTMYIVVCQAELDSI
jgi:hypothetical protein